MPRHLGIVALVVLLVMCWSADPPSSAGQEKAASPSAGSNLPLEKALALAEQGHCRESISTLKRAMSGQAPADSRKKAGVVGLRCALSVDDRDSAAEFVRLLNKQFPRDPDVLFILVHAYSDLSTRAAQDLARTAPESLAAHKLNAEALEMQGRWEPAQLEYEGILQKEPNAQGIHFLLGRLLLSKPEAGPDAAARAKQEFLKEIEIDPHNAGAHYILGELARRDEKCDEAIPRFSQAVKLDADFGEAHLGLASCLIALQRYEEAIAPSREAVRLQQGNPAAHYNLATALSRSGHKEEAEKEFSIHRQLTQKNAPEGSAQ
jgi:tetratricopeptide (TPR) repeat protein